LAVQTQVRDLFVFVIFGWKIFEVDYFEILYASAPFHGDVLK